MSARSAILGALAKLLTPDATGDIELGQTPAQFDSSNRIATTAYARGIGLNSKALIIGSQTILTAANAGSFLECTSATQTSYAIYLPLYATVPPGTMFSFVNVSNVGLTLSRQGNDVLTANGPAIATFDITPGDHLFAISSNGAWVIFGSAALGTSFWFTTNRGAPGYQRLPGGTIFQWGGSTTGLPGWPVGQAFVGFPVAFPSGPYSIVATPSVTSIAPTMGVGPWSGVPANAGFSVYSGVPAIPGVFNGAYGNVAFNWMAIGI